MTAGQTSLDLIRKIILGYLTDLPEEKVYIYNQKYKIPDDEGIEVIISFRTSKVISNRSRNDVTTGYVEVINLNTLESLSINLLSKDLSALRTKELFVMALNSYFSQGIQEANGFKILRIAPINDLSELEGSARLYRFEIPINVFCSYENVTPADYFDQFTFQVIANGEPEMRTAVITQPLPLVGIPSDTILDDSGNYIEDDSGNYIKAG